MTDDDRLRAALASDGSASQRIHDVVVDQVQRWGARGYALDLGAGRFDIAERLVGSGAFELVLAVDLATYVDPPPGVQPVQADVNEPIRCARGPST